MNQPQSEKVCLAKALFFYVYVDEDQRYKDHLLYQSLMVREEEEIIATLLRDVLQKTQITEGTLSNLFGKAISDAVVLLKRSDQEMYLAYVTRLSQNEICRKIELAELETKLSKVNLQKLSYEDFQNMDVLRMAQRILESPISL